MNPTQWTGKRGRISAEAVRSFLPEAGPRILVLICGRSGFCQGAVEILRALKYPNVYVFA